MTKEVIFRSVALFLLAGLLEIAGGYLLWGAIRNKQPFWTGIFGAILIGTYGVVATLQPAGFGRTYAAYGGVFVLMALLWGWFVEKATPDFFDILGAAVVMIGTTIIFFAPRKLI